VKLAEIIEKNTDPESFARAYLDYLRVLLTKMDYTQIAAFINELGKARADGSTVFFIGNGGSAATASHFANDLGIGTRASFTDKPFRVLSLTDNVAAMTAVANDDGYENVFLYQLKTLFKKGDRVVAISASGNSPNLLTAVEWVKKQGGKTIAVTGFDGGALKKMCDMAVHIETPKGEYGPVEDIHMILDHLTMTFLKNHL
jgi:D-sedoheptulose 7-phosphate isomerase